METDSAVERSIGEALVEMLREEKLSDVTVKELARRAHVARSTFYAHYRNVDEVLEQVEGSIVEDLVALNAPIADASRRDAADMGFFRETLAYLDERRDVMRVLLVDRTDPRFVEAWKDGIKGHLRERLPLRDGTPEGDLCMDVAASAMVSACACMFESGDTVDDAFACEVVADVLGLLDKNA